MAVLRGVPAAALLAVALCLLLTAPHHVNAGGRGRGRGRVGRPGGPVGRPDFDCWPEDGGKWLRKKIYRPKQCNRVARQADSYLERMAMIMDCMAKSLNIGTDQASLDAAVEALTSDADFIALWKGSSATCLAAMPGDLTSDEQRSVFLFTCLRGMPGRRRRAGAFSEGRLKLDCDMEDVGQVPCEEAERLLFGKCSLLNLVDDEDIRDCLLEMQASLGALPEDSLDCQAKLDAAKDVIACAMRAGGFATDDVVDTAALGDAIQEASDGIQATWAACPQGSLDDLITCWITTAPGQCIVSYAEMVAKVLGEVMPP